jgi:hypothetical protein
MNRATRLMMTVFNSGGSGIPDPTKTTYLWDTFTDTDAVALEAHTPNIGGAWTKIGANEVAIISNRANHNSGGNTQAIYICDPGIASINLQADIYFGQSSGAYDYAALRIRCADENNGFLITVGKYTSSIYRIEELTAGTPTTRASGTFTYAENAHHVLRVEDDGTLITATIDGANPITYSNTSKNTNTKVAFALSIATTITNRPAIDNLWGYK